MKGIKCEGAEDVTTAETEVQPVSGCDTYSLETDGGGNGIQVCVCVREVREASCLDAFEVHSLKRHNKINESRSFSLAELKSSFLSENYAKRNVLIKTHTH